MSKKPIQKPNILLGYTKNGRIRIPQQLMRAFKIPTTCTVFQCIHRYKWYIALQTCPAWFTTAKQQLEGILSADNTFKSLKTLDKKSKLNYTILSVKPLLLHITGATPNE